MQTAHPDGELRPVTFPSAVAIAATGAKLIANGGLIPGPEGITVGPRSDDPIEQTIQDALANRKPLNVQFATLANHVAIEVHTRTVERLLDRGLTRFTRPPRTLRKPFGRRAVFISDLAAMKSDQRTVQTFLDLDPSQVQDFAQRLPAIELTVVTLAAARFIDAESPAASWVITRHRKPYAFAKAMSGTFAHMRYSANAAFNSGGAGSPASG